MTPGFPFGPLIVVSVFALAACSGSSSSRSGFIDAGLSTEGRIVELDTNGDLPDVGIITGTGSNSVTFKRLSNGAGFAYQMGRVRGTDEFLGVAGITPDAQVGSAPTAATASYSGAYDLAYADRDKFEKDV